MSVGVVCLPIVCMVRIEDQGEGWLALVTLGKRQKKHSRGIDIA